MFGPAICMNNGQRVNYLVFIKQFIMQKQIKANKENEKQLILHSVSDNKSKFYGNSVILASILNQNNKILRSRKLTITPQYSDRIKVLQTCRDIVGTLNIKQISLAKNLSIERQSTHTIKSLRMKSRKNICIQEQSNINLLKMQAAKLDSQFVRFADRGPTENSKVERKNDWEFKRTKMAKMRKIFKGRPTITDLIQRNRLQCFKTGKISRKTFSTLESCRQQTNQIRQKNFRHKKQLTEDNILKLQKKKRPNVIYFSEETFCEID